MNNGLESFSFHSLEPSPLGNVLSIEPATFSVVQTAAIDAGTVAKEYLNQAFASPELKNFDNSSPAPNQVRFEIDSVMSLPLADTKIVKFREYVNDVSVYGSLVTVELDENKKLLSICSAKSKDIRASHLASISPGEALRIAREHLHNPDLTTTPLLYYYYVARDQEFKLVYVLKNVARHPQDALGDEIQSAVGSVTECFDYLNCVIDAESGEILEEMPRVIRSCLDNTAARAPVADPYRADYELLVSEFSGGEEEAGAIVLKNSDYNVITYDFRYQDITNPANKMPGSRVCCQPPPPPAFQAEAIHAHLNTLRVARFIKLVFKRRGLDNEGLAYVSTVNCGHRLHGNREWPNAVWVPALKQMAYGQKQLDGQLVSYAAFADVVAHELSHGIIDSSARLDSRGMAGALNESYADIFGVIIANSFALASWNDFVAWDWSIGRGLGPGGRPLRDLADPASCGHPAHLRDYQDLPQDQANDWGGIHANSSIHSKAACEIIRSGAFTAEETAQLFYVNLVSYLARTSTFKDSLNGLLLATRSLFRKSPPLEVESKLVAITHAFHSIGIGVAPELSI